MAARRFSQLGCLLLVPLALSACKTEASRPGARPVPVVVAPVAKRDVAIEVRAVGQAEAILSVEILPQVGGLLQGVHFKEGQSVHKGDLLFSIDTRPYRASLSAARADLEKSRALAEQAKGELARYERLRSEGLATDQELAQVRANAAALAATLDVGRAAVTSNSINVQFASIRAPIDGRTGALLVKQGNVVRANDTRPLVTIRSIAPIFVRFSVPEQYLGAVRAAFKAGEVSVVAWARGDERHRAAGKLTFIENTVDTTTGKIDMKAEFSNEGDVLWPGQYLDVVLRIGTEAGALVVPDAAVQTGQDGSYVYVVADGRVKLRRVVVGRGEGGAVVIRGGLTEGEVVVTDGQIRLRDGAAVELKPASASPSASAGTPPGTSASGKPGGDAAR